jgi:hypothetical protein
MAVSITEGSPQFQIGKGKITSNLTRSLESLNLSGYKDQYDENQYDETQFKFDEELKVKQEKVTSFEVLRQKLELWQQEIHYEIGSTKGIIQIRLDCIIFTMLLVNLNPNNKKILRNKWDDNNHNTDESLVDQKVLIWREYPICLDYGSLSSSSTMSSLDCEILDNPKIVGKDINGMEVNLINLIISTIKKYL